MERKTRFSIIMSRRPKEVDINQELQWFCDSIGLFGNRDKDKCRFRMFIVLLNALKKQSNLSSDEIASMVNLSRGTVVHHLNQLMEQGIVVSRNGRYMLRVRNLSDLIDEIDKDLQQTISQLRESARDIDDKLNI